MLTSAPNEEDDGDDDADADDDDELLPSLIAIYAQIHNDDDGA